MTNETATNQTQTSTGNAALFNAILTAFNQHIKNVVNKELTAALQNASTLALMDEKLEEKMKVIAQDAAQDAIGEHEAEECHYTEDDVDNFIANYLNRHDYVNEDKLDSKISDALEEKLFEDEYVTESTLEEKVQEQLDEKLDEQMDEKLREMLANLTVQLLLTPTNKEENQE
jgi:hypothetical protein